MIWPAKEHFHSVATVVSDTRKFEGAKIRLYPSSQKRGEMYAFGIWGRNAWLLIMSVIFMLLPNFVSGAPTPSPPTKPPTRRPSPSPTATPTASPTASPTRSPTRAPSRAPTSWDTKIWKKDVIITKFGGVVGAGPWDIIVRTDSSGLIYQNDNVGHFRLDIEAITSTSSGNQTSWTGSTDCITVGSAGTKVDSIIRNTVMLSSSVNILCGESESVFRVGDHIQGANLTDCVPTMGKFTTLLKNPSGFNQNTSDVKRADQQQDEKSVVHLSSLLTVSSQRFLRFINTSSTAYSYEYKINFESPQVLYLFANMSTYGCISPRTHGSWNDISKWVGNQVPSYSDSVIIPFGSGVIEIGNNVTVQNLTMNGGTLYAYNSGCPDGWSVDPIGQVGNKCYKLFENSTNYYDAEAACQNSGLGSIDSHLVEISSHAEMEVVRRMCRSTTPNAPARLHGCWIGLQDPQATGDFEWIEPLAARYPTSYRDWRRGNPNNRTFSEGNSTNGERCVQLVPWQEDPLIVEQGSWNDNACALQKAYVCQAYKTTTRYTITVLATAQFSGSGILEGGILALYGQRNYLTSLLAIRSALITIRSSKVVGLGLSPIISIIGSIGLEDGATLDIGVNAEMHGAAALGELNVAPLTTQGMQPAFYLQANNTFHVRSDCPDCLQKSYVVSVNAGAFIYGSLVVDNGTTIQLNRGADMSYASVNVVGEGSVLVLSGGCTRASTYDAFEITMSHRGPVTGEYLSSGNELNVLTGVYRLKVTDTRGRVNLTACIDYHADADTMAASLNNLPMIQERGGVTVRRYGPGGGNGIHYVYRIETDSVATKFFALGQLTLSLFCYGPSLTYVSGVNGTGSTIGIGNGCGCAETKVTLIDSSTSTTMCPLSGKSSKTDPGGCVIPPKIVVSRMSSLSYMKTTGNGMLQIDGGTHRLPPVTNIRILANSGTGIAAADIIDWKSLETAGVGNFIFTGTGWIAWDSSVLLFRPSWEEDRGILSYLLEALPFNMHVNEFHLSGQGSIMTASPGSNLTWATGSWSSGAIGGRATLYITESLEANGNPKALQNVMTMYVKEGAKFSWLSGNISLANGARIIVEGEFSVENTNHQSMFMGEAILMRVIPSDVVNANLLISQDPTQWHGYFDNLIVPELRTGWYQNPLCGDSCMITNQLLLRESGIITVKNEANVTFLLPVNMIGSSRVNMGRNAFISLDSGGICGNQVVMNISEGTTLQFSGGRVLMQATCAVQGAGELVVIGGEHDLSFIIDAHITISGGAMVWPITRGAGQSIHFNGGLLIDQSGMLQVQSFATSIYVENEVHFKDNGVVQFPVVGSAVGPSNFDEPDAPDKSPRGALVAKGVMRFEGGTLEGKADFSAHELYLYGGTKTIKALAKLVNNGHAEWSTGDIVMEDGADFRNLGNLQMGSGFALFNGSNLIQGTIIPIENGGDVFSLYYHSWDRSFDSFTQYVSLRTEFVSRAPVGWTEASQLPDAPL